MRGWDLIRLDDTRRKMLSAIDEPGQKQPGHQKADRYERAV